MRFILPLTLLLLAPPALAQDFGKLPAWAAPEARAAAQEAPPAGSLDAWVLLDRTEIAYGGNNEIWRHHYRLVKVLGERGLGEAVYTIRGLGGKASRIKKLRGWNVRPDGDVTQLDEDEVVILEDAGEARFSRDTLTGARLARATKGSLIAFESLQVDVLPFGPIVSALPLESYPVRRWELTTGKREGWFTKLDHIEVKVSPVRFGGLVPPPQASQDQTLTLTNLAALPRDEDGVPPPIHFLPKVVVRFLDPRLTTAPVWDGWDRPAVWFHDRYQEKSKPVGVVKGGGDPTTTLGTLLTWMGKELTYKQVYLTPDRGWMPEEAPETARKRYGDCKDLACFFNAEAQGLGLKAYPALARIVSGRIQDLTVVDSVFNHVISAVRLDRSLGLPSEVDTPKGRFLLVDATDPLTPLGLLPGGHAQGKVMICLPDGALWVDVPTAACPTPTLDLTLAGEVSPDGSLVGTLRLRETASAWGLRNTARSEGRQGIREFLMENVLNLPPNGTLEVVRHSEPFDHSGPFEVELKIVHPAALTSSGGERVLVTHGLNVIPPAIQKPGIPRQLPVERSARAHVTYRADIKVPQRLSPILPSKELRTPFREARWTAEAQPLGTGCLLKLSLDHQAIPRFYPHAEREQGVLDWKKDRTAAKNLLEDGFAFKPVP